jgi:hypothetical protein
MMSSVLIASERIGSSVNSHLMGAVAVPDLDRPRGYRNFKTFEAEAL